MSFDSVFSALFGGNSLTSEETEILFEEVFLGNVSEQDIAKILIALHTKGETFEEIAGAAKVMRKFSTKISPNISGLLDVCGTGGSGSAKTFNLSSLVAFIVAGAGVPVAKHGNRASTSKSGSADVLEALGISLTLPPEEIARQIEIVGIGFLFAPSFHPAMKFVQPVRKQLGIRTIFNLIGPLTSPASAEFQLMGVFEKSLCEPIAKALQLLGVHSAMVVHGEDGLDEITTTGKTFFAFFQGNGAVETGELDPQLFGIPPASLSELRGGDAKENAEILQGILSGTLLGAKRNLALVNSAAALFVAGKCQSFEEGTNLARESIDSKKALQKLEALRGWEKNEITP